MSKKGIPKSKLKLAETHPEIAKMLLNEELSTKYSYGSGRKVDWICPRCKSEIKNKVICDVVSHGLSCKMCGDKISIGEKIMYNVLKSLKVDFSSEKSFEWSNNKRYDFYIPSLNMIIEVHGEQHYKNAFTHVSKQTVEDERANDNHKKSLALSNGVKSYIEINTSKRDYEFIKNNIINSELNDVFDFTDLNWNECFVLSSKSRLIEVVNMFNNGLRVNEISEEFSTSKGTVISYLKRGSSLNLCDYNPERERGLGLKNAHNKTRKKVVQLTRDGEYVKTWDSITEACMYFTGKKSAIIGLCCSGIKKTAYNFKWMHLEDYEKAIIK